MNKVLLTESVIFLLFVCVCVFFPLVCFHNGLIWTGLLESIASSRPYTSFLTDIFEEKLIIIAFKTRSWLVHNCHASESLRLDARNLGWLTSDEIMRVRKILSLKMPFTVKISCGHYMTKTLMCILLTPVASLK